MKPTFVMSLALLLLAHLGSADPGKGNGAGQPTPDEATVPVDCDAGDTITEALRRSAVELTVEFTGTCVEDVTVLRDRTVVRGVGSSAIEGSLRVDGATLVVLEDFSVHSGGGVRITGASSANLARIDSVDSSGLGFRVELSSNATLTDVTATNNVFAGIGAINNSHVRLLGTVAVSQSSNVGIFAGGSSEIDSRATVQTSDNAYAGIWAQSGASASFSNVSASNNGVVGVAAVNDGILAIRGGTISGSWYGVDLDTGSTAQLDNLTVDGGGVAVLGNSSLRATGLTVTGSAHPDFGAGVVVQGGHLLAYGGNIDNGLRLAEGGEGNFGFTPITIVGGISCAPSALAYGGQSCP